MSETITRHAVLSQLSCLFRHVSSRRKAQFVFLIVLTAMSSVAEIASLGAVVPFIGILTQPERVFQQPNLQWAVDLFNIESADQLVLPLTIGFAIAAIIAGILRLVLLWVGIRLGNAAGVDLGIQIFQKTLYQPYKVHISRHSSEIISVITQKVGAATIILISTVTFSTSLILFGAILVTLLIVDPLVAIIASFSFGTTYMVIARMTRSRIVSNSHQIATEQTNVVRSLQEGLGAIRDVLLNNAQSFYSNLYHQSVVKLYKAQSENTFVNQAPRFAMEAIGLVLIALLAFVLSKRDGGVGEALPALGLLALGAQRLIPLMQQIYGNWSLLAGSKASLQDVLEYLDQPVAELEVNRAVAFQPFREKIVFKNVAFRYGDSQPDVLRNIDLEIRRGERVGFIGTTGSGKSTLLDLLMGLLEPTGGKIFVDGIEIESGNRQAWQNNIAHVPQHIFLADTSFLENIGFGFGKSNIDVSRVKKAAKQANVDKLIESRPGGYNQLVGERGVQLSGGERQRIGIARALYRNADILVFDEATSALDTDTEAEVMTAIEDLSSDLTVLIIAHRLTTLKSCDKIVELDKSTIYRIGTYKELIGSSA